jgi:hypothetical protein
MAIAKITSFKRSPSFIELIWLPGRGVNHPPSFRFEVKEILEL